MTTRFYNAKILNGDMTVADGELCVRGGVIECVCGACENGGDYEKEIDCKGGLLIPGFKNAHAHSAMTFLRSRADDLPLHEWLNEQVFPQEAKLTAEHIYWFTKLAILEYVSGGITAAFDMYFEPEAVASAARETGFKITMCGAVNDFGTTPAKLRDYYEKYNGYDELVAYKLGFHAEYTNSVGNMRAVAEMSRGYKAPVYTHMCETKAETDGCIERHGKTPPALFEELGLWEHGGGAFHCVHVNDDDVGIMARNRIWAVSNPCSNLKLASGVAPLTKMAAAGINIALGTDGAASNNALSMFREMYSAVTLQKYLTNDAAACPAYNALNWAFSGGASAMGLEGCDCLAAGKKADIVMLDLNRPAMLPHNNIVKNIVYSGDASAVKMTMVNGKILYYDGEFFTGDKAETIIEKTRDLMKDFD
ncbi:MAG: amidohydrolase [Oscillospiraceae bacterium]|jgi:5-methylthioadenosine/S-adenosylhomocysteine deaminase|nr:amidohydrolase [Oscillospiraceae bacterium]